MKRNIALFTGKLAGGGAERMASRLSFALSEHYNVFILIYNSQRSDYYASGKIIDLGNGASRTSLRFLHSIIQINRVIKENNIELVISFLELPNLINSFFNYSCKKAVSIRSWIDSGEKNLKNYLAGAGARKADGIIAMTFRQKQFLMHEMNVPEEKIWILENLYDCAQIKNAAYKKIADQKIRDFVNSETAIAVGRLVKKKNYFRLLKIFSYVHQKDEKAKLLILGEGKLLEKLKTLSKSYGIEDRVMFASRAEDPFPIIANSAFYISVSENEGFPNALMEAMICGIPVMHTDCLCGPFEILSCKQIHEECHHISFEDYGILLPIEKEGKEEEIADLWIRMLKDENLRSHYAKMSQIRAEMNDTSLIKEKYIQMIEFLTGASKC